MVLLRMIGGDEMHIRDSCMIRLLKDTSIGRFKRCSIETGGGYSHVTYSSSKQSRLNMMLVQYMCDDNSELDNDLDSELINDDLEHSVRKAFNNVQDVSRVDAVINASKHVKLEQCMKQLELHCTASTSFNSFYWSPRMWQPLTSSVWQNRYWNVTVQTSSW